MIKTDEGYTRDKSGIIINNNYNEYLKILEARKEQKKSKSLENRVKTLEEKIQLLEEKIK